MKKAGPRRRGGGGVQELDASPVVALLLFEAADCLMALPASEVTRLLAPESQGASAGNVAAPEEWIDLEEYFTGRRSEGPWLQWGRGQRRAWLRVARVVEVLPCPIRALVPMPAWLRAERGPQRGSRAGGPEPRAGTFWAAGVRGDEVFLLMDPARLADPRES
jgi:hypothetical protein